MVRNYKKVEKPYTQSTIAIAVKEVQDGASIRVTSQKYHLSFSLLRKHVKRNGNEGAIEEDMRGKKTQLSADFEEKNADFVRRMEKMGLGPTLLEFRHIVQDYLVANGIETLFKDSLPGYEWAKSFMHRHNMTLKTGGMMQLARKSVTSDPFVIYEFNELMKNEMERLEILDRPECIWNLDETGFPLDPSKTKTIATKGSKTVRVTSGSNRENITVLATCCANGSALDPLIVFKGKNMQSSWIGTTALPETQYAVSESGWMTHVIFEDFFKSFVEKTKETRPLLLILDGHLSHTSLQKIEIAKQENISIIKLPAHSTDLLQPLDISCFAPLKSLYDLALMQHVHQTGARAPLQKRGFVNMLCSVWKQGLSTKNVKAGFDATGIHPLNSEKYDKGRLCPMKLKTFKTWLNKGRPRDDKNDPVLFSTATEKEAGSSDSQLIESSINEEEASQISTSISHEVVSSTIPGTEVGKCLPDRPSIIQEGSPGCSHWAEVQVTTPGELLEDVKKNIQQRGSLYAKHLSWKDLVSEIQARAPPDMKFNILLVEKTEETSLEEVLYSRGRSGTYPIPRRKINMHSQIITQRSYNEELENHQVQKGRTINIKSSKRKKREPGPLSDSTTTEEEIALESDSADDVSFTLDKEESDMEYENKEVPAPTETEIPAISENSVGKYYAVYYTEPRMTYFGGKILKTFSDDDDSSVAKAEIDYLQKKNISSNPREWTWIERNKDKKNIGIVDTTYIFYGPEDPTIKKGLLRFPDDKAYARLKKMEKDLE